MKETTLGLQNFYPEGNPQDRSNPEHKSERTHTEYHAKAAETALAELGKLGRPITLDFNFSAHVNSTDAQSFIEKLPQADAVFIEAMDASEKFKNDIKDIAAGRAKVTPRQTKRGKQPKEDLGFFYALLKNIERIQKPVNVLDVPADSQVANRLKFWFTKGLPSYIHNYTSATDVMAMSLKTIVDLQIEREIYILKELPKKVEEILPQLNMHDPKRPANILLQYGAHHYPLYEALRKAKVVKGITIQQNLSESAHTLNIRSIPASQAYRNNTEPKQEQVARELLYSAISPIVTGLFSLFNNHVQSTSETEAMVNNIMDTFSDEEIYQLLNINAGIWKEFIASHLMPKVIPLMSL